jgi:hypothetical protein
VSVRRQGEQAVGDRAHHLRLGQDRDDLADLGLAGSGERGGHDVELERRDHSLGPQRRQHLVQHGAEPLACQHEIDCPREPVLHRGAVIDLHRHVPQTAEHRLDQPP